MCRGNNLLASLAVFRNMYDYSKNDIYSLISLLTKEVIIETGIKDFDAKTITDLVNERFNFEIPLAVVKTAIRRLENIDNINGRYVVIKGYEKAESDGHFQVDVEENTKNIELVIKMLFDYMENCLNQKITDANKQAIIDNFCDFVINEETTNGDAELFSAFVMKYSLNADFMKILGTIREGVILYEGLKYNPSVIELGSWKNNLTLYLETEILFSIAGLNGELYKLILDDLLKFINEINESFKRKNSKNRIRMKYFTLAKDEVDAYFYAAEKICQNEALPDNSRSAMRIILAECKTPSDVIAKKNQFYTLMKSLKIEEDNYDYYSEEDQNYNIESEDTYAALKAKLKHDRFSNNFRQLNYINILRRGKNNVGFDNIEYLLLSGNRTTWQIAWDESIRKETEVPLATTVNFLTSKFWFKLNKGFGGENLPRNLDIITKARLILSSHISSTLSHDYEKLVEKFRKKEISQDELVSTHSELRQKSYLPEEVNENNADEIILFLSNHSLEKHLMEYDHQKRESKAAIEENVILKNTLASLERENTENLAQLNRFKRIEFNKKRRAFIMKRLLIILLIGSATGYVAWQVFQTAGGTVISSVTTVLCFLGIDWGTGKDKITKVLKYEEA